MAKATLYEIGQDAPFPVSRAKLENYVQCPRCFVLDRRHKVAPPSGPSFTLNSAVDGLLKKEFDVARAAQVPHEAVAELGYGFIPLADERMDEWRNAFKGIRSLHEPSNIELYGGVDDVWVDPDSGNVLIVDYKTTAKSEPVTELGDAEYHNAYRRQLEVYQWLLRANGLTVNDTGYWFYATARKNADSFDRKLVFDYTLVAHEGDTSWIEPALLALKADLDREGLPAAKESCEMCQYLDKRRDVENS